MNRMSILCAVVVKAMIVTGETSSLEAQPVSDSRGRVPSFVTRAEYEGIRAKFDEIRQDAMANDETPPSMLTMWDHAPNDVKARFVVAASRGEPGAYIYPMSKRWDVITDLDVAVAWLDREPEPFGEQCIATLEAIFIREVDRDGEQNEALKKLAMLLYRYGRMPVGSYIAGLAAGGDWEAIKTLAYSRDPALREVDAESLQVQRQGRDFSEAVGQASVLGDHILIQGLRASTMPQYLYYAEASIYSVRQLPNQDIKTMNEVAEAMTSPFRQHLRYAAEIAVDGHVIEEGDPRDESDIKELTESEILLLLTAGFHRNDALALSLARTILEVYGQVQARVPNNIELHAARRLAVSGDIDDVELTIMVCEEIVTQRVFDLLDRAKYLLHIVAKNDRDGHFREQIAEMFSVKEADAMYEMSQLRWIPSQYVSDASKYTVRTGF